jgi:hypothetical protein
MVLLLLLLLLLLLRYQPAMITNSCMDSSKHGRPCTRLLAGAACPLPWHLLSTMTPCGRMHL